MENTGPVTIPPQSQEQTNASLNTPGPASQFPQEAPISPATSPGFTPPTGSTNNSVPPANVTTIESKKGGKGFGVFVVAGVIVILCIYGYVGYLYLQNQKLKNSNSNSANQNSASSNVTPTPEFNKDYVKVTGGNIVYDNGSGSPKTLIDKSNFTGTGITGFIKVNVSPDNQKMCFEAWPPAPTPALYIANIDGSSVTQINEKRKNCLWTNDSTKLLYTNITSPVLASNIYLFNIETKEEKNLTQPTPGVVASKNFDIVGLSADGGKVICKYETIGKDEAGQCEIDLSSFEISYL